MDSLTESRVARLMERHSVRPNLRKHGATLAAALSLGYLVLLGTEWVTWRRTFLRVVRGLPEDLGDFAEALQAVRMLLSTQAEMFTITFVAGACCSVAVLTWMRSSSVDVQLVLWRRIESLESRLRDLESPGADGR
ncbi:MAG: hypothetical protein OXR73_08860 [Myxococcales bacterium]|nr:hypothetical protein [Myxococcales bacterium]